MLTINQIIFGLIILLVIYYYTTSAQKTSSTTSAQKTVTTKDNTQDLDLVMRRLNINTLENPLIFNSDAVVVNNLYEFIKFIMPNININNVNKLLIDNGLNKTIEQILSEHRNDNPKSVFYKLILINIYGKYILNTAKLTNKEEIETQMKINNLIVHYLLIQIFPVSNELLVNNDYLTSDNITIYYKNNDYQNREKEQISLTNINTDLLNKCSTLKFCYVINPENETFLDFHERTHLRVLPILDDANKSVELTLVQSLFNLENIQLTDYLQKENARLNEIVYSVTNTFQK